MTWPTQLPANPTVSLAARNLASAAGVTMESGRVRVQRVFGAECRLLNAMWFMTNLQFGMFQAFLTYKLTGGEDWFLCTLPVGVGTTREVTARIVNGEWSAEPADAKSNWRVRCTLEVQDAGVPT